MPSFRSASFLGFELRNSWHFLAHGKPDPAYGLNCYPAKMHASTIGTMVRYARLRPDRRDAALKLARTAADYLISISQPAGAPLEHMPPTYEGKAYTASAYAGQQMMLYPALAADAYLSLHEATKEAKYLEAAKRIAETYLKLQGADGTCFRSTGPRPGHFIGGAWDFGYGEWACPSVMEQYRCYVPIDASAAKLINTFMALYRAERNPLDLAKARALAATAIRVQEPSGRIATFWTAGGFRDPNGDWINCMAAIARALENLE